MNENGKVVVEDCRRAFNPRGKIYSIPKPKGGRQVPFSNAKQQAVDCKLSSLFFVGRSDIM